MFCGVSIPVIIPVIHSIPVMDFNDNGGKMINLTKLKIEYNRLLQRQKKAELYLNNPNIHMETIIYSYLPEYQRIVKKLSILLLWIPAATNDEILNGF